MAITFPITFAGLSGAIPLSNLDSNFNAINSAIGTSAGNLVALNGSAKLPAVDGSLLTNLPTGVVPWAQISGFLPTSIVGTNNTTATITVTAGQAIDSTNISALSIATSSSWSLANGNAALGYQGGTTFPNSTTIHWYVCSGGTGTTIFASSSLSPTLPTGYTTYYRRIFSLWTDSSGKLMGGNGGVAREAWGGSLAFFLGTQSTLDVNGTTLSTSRSLLTLGSVPTGIQVWTFGRMAISLGTNAGGIVCSPDEFDVAPSSTSQVGLFSAAPGADYGANASYSAGISSRPWLTNTSGQIAARASTGTPPMYLQVTYWIDQRRA